MGVSLFKDGAWKVHDENTFTDRLNEGWSLSDVPATAPQDVVEDKGPHQSSKKKNGHKKAYGR